MIHKRSISTIQFILIFLFAFKVIKMFANLSSLLLQKPILMTSASQKKINARIQKWRTMLSTGLHKDQALLHSRTRKGIPPQIRLVAWPQLVKLRKHIEQRTPQFTYEKLLNSLSNNIYEISLDIPRTFPEQQDTKVLRKSMNNVLKGIAIVHPKIGYCQGMNFLVARLLTVLGDQQVFWLMDYLVINDKYLRNNFINPKHIATNTSIFQRLLNKTHPHILPIFAQKSIFIQSYTIKCFMTLFSSVLCQQLFDRIFEVYLLQGWSIIYAVAIVLFTRFEKQYKNGSMEDIHLILSKKMYQVGDGDVQWVMSQAYKLELTPEKVRQVQIEVERENAKTSKIGRGSMTSELELQKREQANKQMVKFMPQTQNFTTLIFQNKAEQVNFDPLYILSKKSQQ